MKSLRAVVKVGGGYIVEVKEIEVEDFTDEKEMKRAKDRLLKELQKKLPPGGEYEVTFERIVSNPYDR